MAIITDNALLEISSLLLILILVHVDGYEELTVQLYKVTRDGALIDWHFAPLDKNKDLDYCEYVYSPVADKEQQQISSDLIPDQHTIELDQLEYNITYYFYLVCYDKKNKTVVSNTINFTTGYERDEPINYLMSKSQYSSSGNGDNPDPYSGTSEIDRTHSSNVILGAICGIVGFLIINVTVVLAVRKYSHWQIRRRRILELLEDRDYNGFEYLQNVE